VYPADTDPYQLTPSLTKLRISIFPGVTVMVGTLVHLTLVKVADPFPVVGACLSSKMKLFPAPTAGIVKVQAVLAVRVAVSTVPLVRDKVAAVVTVPMVTTDSV
jgi:hypothetical protein